jgi:monovalent cation:H+ antiporter-2, CPA2 family
MGYKYQNGRSIVSPLAVTGTVPCPSTFFDAFKGDITSSLQHTIGSLKGAKSESLILLGLNGIITPLFTRLKLSPIVGFLLTGILLGPNGFNLVKNMHMVDSLGEIGIVLFLFEMGLELSIEKLMSMKTDVFGLGTAQYVITSLLFTLIARFLNFSLPAALTIGGSLALSSSAFVLQLLKDYDVMDERYSKASFGILLLQDLAVVPLLVVIQLLSKGGSNFTTALSCAAIKAVISVLLIVSFGRNILPKFLSYVRQSKSHEAFTSAITTVPIFMSFLTHGVGLSDSLGAFATGISLATSKHRHYIEDTIAPVRALLLSFFFLKIGSTIDPRFIRENWKLIATLLISLLSVKAAVISTLCLLFRIPRDQALKCGLINAQGGEFAFVAFGIAEAAGLLQSELVRLISTVVALSMAITPLLAQLGSMITPNDRGN